MAIVKVLVGAELVLKMHHMRPQGADRGGHRAPPVAVAEVDDGQDARAVRVNVADNRQVPVGVVLLEEAVGLDGEGGQVAEARRVTRNQHDRVGHLTAPPRTRTPRGSIHKSSFPADV